MTIEVHKNGNGSAIETTKPSTATGLVPSTLADAFKLASAAAASRMFGMSTPEQALMCLMRGMELGFGPATSLSAFHVIEGKPTLTADAQVAICKSRKDLCKYFVLVTSTDKEATYKTHRVGDPDPVTMSFTTDDATRAGLLPGKDSSNWRKYPKAMLRHRAGAALAREVYPELLMGIYDPEEIASIPEPIQAEVTMATARTRSVEDIYDDFVARIRLASSLKELAAVAREIGTLSKDVKETLRPIYDARKSALQPPPDGGGSPKPEAPTQTEATGEATETETTTADDIVHRWDAHLASKPAAQAVANSIAAHLDEIPTALRARCLEIGERHMRRFVSDNDARSMIADAMATHAAKAAA